MIGCILGLWLIPPIKDVPAANTFASIGNNAAPGVTANHRCAFITGVIMSVVWFGMFFTLFYTVRQPTNPALVVTTPATIFTNSTSGNSTYYGAVGGVGLYGNAHYYGPQYGYNNPNNPTYSDESDDD